MTFDLNQFPTPDEAGASLNQEEVEFLAELAERVRNDRCFTVWIKERSEIRESRIARALKSRGWSFERTEGDDRIHQYESNQYAYYVQPND